MTEKLYYLDSHRTECDAVVRACTETDRAYEVLLDRTVIFPEGGGQPCDLGTVGDAAILFARDDGAEVTHIVSRPLPVGETVHVTLDWERRFDFMQQHSGEHLLSFAFYSLFGANNVGFHLADTYTTIDFDRPLSNDDILCGERLANRFVWSNAPVSAVLYDSEEAVAGLPLRKHARGLKPPIRIVSVEGADCCTCCAPHVSFTGEIGMIRIADAVSYKGGTRITFHCGQRALLHAEKEHLALDAIARRFSASREQAEDAVEKLANGYAASKHAERALASELNGYVARELIARADEAGKRRVVVKLFNGMDSARLKELAQAATPENGAALLLARQGERLGYVVTTSNGLDPDAGELIKAVNAACNGRGGGRGTLAQGMAQSNVGAESAVEQLRTFLIARLRG